VIDLLQTISTQLPDDDNSSMLVADLQFQFQEYQKDDVQFTEFLELFFKLRSDPTKGTLVKMMHQDQVHWLAKQFRLSDYDDSGFISVLEFRDFLLQVGVDINH
jgi:Ca2+-binding EF-hand superfamily protein